MFRTRVARALLVPAALLIPASGAVLALTSSPAGAAVPASADVATCTGLTGTVNIATEAATGKLTGCTKSPTGGTGQFSGSASSSSGSITWKNKGTSTFSFGYTVGGQGICPASNDEIIVTGKVKTSTGKAAAIKKGQKISGGSAANTADFCFNTTTEALTLAPGTTFQI